MYLTYAEYQALTPEQQLDGTEYFITDINGDGQDFQPICYSEEEREIGVWIDGKPLYEKTVSISPTSLSHGTTIAHGISNVDTVVWLETLMIRSSNRSIILPYAPTSNAFSGFYADRTNIIFTGGDTWQSTDYSNLYATIRYTKITDQAGSGTWTPQGVPAHHYSTDEQVVGTWVDGNTLYEKTVSFVTPSSNAYTRQNLGLLTADIDNIWIAEGYAIGANTTANVSGYTSNPSSEEFMGFIYKDSTDITFDYRVGSSVQNGNAYLTIRYTKSST